MTDGDALALATGDAAHHVVALESREGNEGEVRGRQNKVGGREGEPGNEMHRIIWLPWRRGYGQGRRS